ncbi:MAG: response regulator [Mucilaginibacter sp.]|nr:response regulator [Mucilaginibacter sp.]
MKKNRGSLLEYVIRKQNIDITDLCKKLNINRRTLYNWFDDENLSLDSIIAVSKAISYSFFDEFPELNENASPNIYLIEDSDLDIEIFKLSIGRFNISNSITVFRNGEDAINSLLQTCINEPEQLPDFIFLDLNMPLLNGWDFLSHFHRLDICRYKKIKTYILSSSRSSVDIAKSAENPLVTEFISKPIELSKIKSIIEKNRR